MNACSATLATWLTFATMATSLAACRGLPTTPPEKRYDFELQPVLCNSDVVGINVTPKGGNRRIKIDRNFEQILVWTSKQEFSIKFEKLDADGGRGGSSLGGPTNWTKATQVGSDYVFKLTLDSSTGSGTETAKYALKRKGGDTFELDPVIIVDR